MVLYFLLCSINVSHTRQVLFTGLPRHLRWLAMTEVCGAAYPGTEWERVLVFSDHPAATRHPSNGGELGMVLYFFICVLLICRIRACIIYWIATPSVMARNDKRGRGGMYC